MKRKARIQTGIDDRLVAIYARKSRITNKGDSIGVQFKQSADYAINQLSLPEDYEFVRYEDKGLSGYYSDRPDFQRLLRDIEMGKIKAVACYKLDRISRKTSDLMRLLEYFERHDVTLLVCSNNINTRISTSKIIIQVLAIIAEFERDILTERIQDNLMELAKDGRWLGGKTPTGFSSQRVTTGSGKNKSAISFLVPVQEEKEIVLEIYSTFWETRSLLQTANIISEKYETKHGAKFTTSTIRLILRNPIYCVADEYSYNYFLEHGGNLFGEPSDFDGQHGLTAYNKTDQMKVEDEDSTFFNPKFSQLLTRKPISEWIVSVGHHEGFISSRKWVETQNMLDEIAEKYNRPHRKTNALLSGLMYCPICGKRLRVLPESNRWTNGKPRFKYACPGVRAKECTFKGVEGVTLDEFVIHSLSSLQEEHSDYYRQLLENKVAGMIRTDQSEKEYQETKKAIERLNADIAAQVRNLREADDALKRFIQDDIKELTDELAKREAALRRMEDTQSENQYLIHELNGMKKRLLSFEEFAKDAQPEALFTLVHSIVDRIYITTDGTKQKCQVYIKGCATEDYSDVLGAAGYIEEEPLLPVVSYMPPMCDLDYYSIADFILSGFTIMSFVRGFENFMMDMLVERENVDKLADIVFGAEEDLIRECAKAGFDAICLADDWGTQTSLLISRDLIQEIFMPRYKKQIDLAHSLGLDVIMHCCGHIIDIIGDFIDIGLDALNPGQPRLNGLDEMGDRFRGKICFACPIGYQSTAIQGTVQDIYDEVRDYVDKLSTDKGGFMGFVASFNGIYSLGAPEENARAVEKAFEKYCGCRD